MVMVAAGNDALAEEARSDGMHADSAHKGGVYMHTTPDDWSEPEAAASAGYNSQTADRSIGSAATAHQKNPMERLVLAIVGIVLILVGIPMLILPGPGVAAIVIGGVCIARAFGHVNVAGR